MENRAAVGCRQKPPEAAGPPPDSLQKSIQAFIKVNIKPIKYRISNN